MDLRNIFEAPEVLAGGSAVSIVFYVLEVIAMWRIFEKAGEAGWKALIPIYNLYILCKIVNFNWWLLLGFLIFLVPIFGWVIGWVFSGLYIAVLKFVIDYNLAKSFGKGLLFTLGLFFFAPIFYLILGFGSAKYHKARR